MKKLLILFLCLVLALFTGCSRITDLFSDTSSIVSEPEQVPLVQGEVFDYCYNSLNDTQKDMYNKILTGIYYMQTDRIYLTDDETDISKNVNLAYGAVSIDHPELFWLSGEYQLLTLGGEKFYIKIKYDIDETTRDAQVAALNKRVEEIIAATEGMTPPEKELYFHDYLCENVTYTNDGVSTRYSAFGALVNGKAVCEGYSRAMQLLCKTAGINCSLIKGTSENEAHMWNVVEIYGEWYELDVTWDDLEEQGTIYEFFNITTTEMQKTHQRYNEITSDALGVSLEGLKYNLNPPQCTADEYSKNWKEKNQ